LLIAVKKRPNFRTQRDGKIQGGRLSYRGLVKIFQRLSKHFGIRIAPHDARDAAATTWAISAPERIGVARDLLAHSDLRTTNRHYNRAKGIEASRAYRQAITEIRRKRYWRGG
jgi:integrase